MARLAAAHHAQRDDFVRALVAEAHLCAVTPLDYDAQPPPRLLESLSERTGWSRLRFERMLLKPPESVLPLKSGVREAYCPECWRADAAQGERRIRRQWRERWTVLCETHQTPLFESRLPIEVLLSGYARDPEWREDGPDGFFPGHVCLELLRSQQLLRALASDREESPEASDRARVLRDLALLVGMPWRRGSLIQWSLAGPGVWRKRYGWETETLDITVTAPRGATVVRRHALRLATLLMLRMDGPVHGMRSEDQSVLVLLQHIGPQTDLAWACNQLRRTWSPWHRGRWSAAFEWPETRDPVYFAQQVWVPGTPLNAAQEAKVDPIT